MEAEGYSHSEKHQVVYRWKIDEITSLFKSSKEMGFFLDSPKFSTGAKINDLWFLQLQIYKSRDNTLRVTICLCPNNKTQKARTKYLIFFINNKGEKIIQLFDDDNNKVKGEDEKFNRIFTSRDASFRVGKLDDILAKKDELFKNDTLTVHLDLTVYDEYVNFDIISSSKSSKRKLGDDFRDLFETKKKCDVTIAAGDDKFYAHKLVLITRSSVFEAMFFHNLKENKENEINIPDIAPQVVKKLLEFIYTDKVDELDNFAEELLEAADKYHIQGLKDMCEDFLAKTLNVENAIRILILADRHNATTRLKEFIMNYVIINLVTLKTTEEYQVLVKSQPSLALALLQKYVEGIKTD